MWDLVDICYILVVRKGVINIVLLMDEMLEKKEMEKVLLRGYERVLEYRFCI